MNVRKEGTELTKLQDTMNLEEMGMVFPIILSEYNPAWPVLYSSEKDLIEKTVGSQRIVKISHIGSTAVPGMVAKPTIDILLEIRDDVDRDELIRIFSEMGYLCNPQPRNPAPHVMFIKGYTPEGYSGQAYHVHVRYSGDWDEPYFCNYLVRYPAVAEHYIALKQKLIESCGCDREAYTWRKTEFIESVMEIARKDPEGHGDQYLPHPFRDRRVGCYNIAEHSSIDSPSIEQKVLMLWFNNSAAFDVEMIPSAWARRTMASIMGGLSPFAISSPGSFRFQPFFVKNFRIPR